MPRPEQGGGQGRAGEERQGYEPGKEKEAAAYYQAARFNTELLSRAVYLEAQEIIYADEKCDLSAYRMQISRVWHVAVLGIRPSYETDAALAQVLSEGELVPLPAEVLNLLQERREHMKEPGGGWVEGHYRPGRPLEPREPQPPQPPQEP